MLLLSGVHNPGQVTSPILHPAARIVGGEEGRRSQTKLSKFSFQLSRFLGLAHLSLWKRLVVYTVTWFKPWPLTSTCNWRHSPKRQNTVAGPGLAESVTTNRQHCTQQVLLQLGSPYCVGIRAASASQNSPVFSESKRSCFHLLPNEKGCGEEEASTSHTQDKDPDAENRSGGWF